MTEPLCRDQALEETLRTAAQEWRITFDAIQEGIFLLDAEGRVLRCNRAAAGFLNKPFAELIGRRWADLVGVEPPGESTSEFTLAKRWFRLSASPVPGQAGGTVLALADVTDNRRGAQALRESEERYRELLEEAKRSEELYRLLVDTIPTSVVLVDAQWRVVLANQTLLEKTRQSDGIAAGKPLAAVLPEVILQEGGLGKAIRQVFQESKEVRGQKLTYKAPGLPRRTYRYSVVPMTWNGSVVNALLLMDDITEQIRLGEEIRRVENHLASVVESARDIVLSTDTEGRILSWNQAAQRISGYAPDEVRQRFLFEYCSGECQARVQSIFRAMRTAAADSRIARIRRSKRKSATTAIVQFASRHWCSISRDV